MTVLYILLLLQALDLASTVYFMSRPQLGLTEGNPLLAKLFEFFGTLPTLIAFKGFLMGFAYFYQAQIPVELIWAACALYVWVVFNNIKLIRGSN